jgi:type II secretory pathway pseudopilin PulG
MKNRQNSGYSLIELVIFIIVIGIGISVLIPLVITLSNVHLVDKNIQATKLAEQRMEIILNDYRTHGFSTFLDPCQVSPIPPICNVSNLAGATQNPPGFTVTSEPIEQGNLIDTGSGWLGPIDDGDAKLITVNVTGKSSSTLQAAVTDY